MKLETPGVWIMLSRLVMVVLVAALGVTLPSEPECRRVIGTIQHWANTRLAMLDTWSPEGDEPGLTAEGRPPRPWPAFEQKPTTVAAGRFVGPPVETVLRVRRVGRWMGDVATGPMVPPRVLITTRLLERTAAPAKVAAVPKIEEPAIVPSTGAERLAVATEPFQSPIPVSEGVVSALAWELERRLELVTVERPEPLEAAAAVVESPRVAPAATVPFVDGIAAFAAREAAWDQVAVVEPASAALDFEPLEMCGDVEWTPTENAVAVADQPAVARNDAPTWTPMDLPEILDQGAAYDLNRAAEGLTRVATTTASAAPITTVSPPRPPAAVAEAVRLTRDALGAWLGVLKSTDLRVVTSR